MDKIILSGLSFFAYHGVLEEEQRLGQKFQVDLELHLDLSPAGTSDELEKTVSYAEVHDVVEQVVTGTPRKLLEAVAEGISVKIFEKFQPVRAIRVIIKKPGAPIKGNFDFMAVEIFRERV